jgi:hypothetical protein
MTQSHGTTFRVPPISDRAAIEVLQELAIPGRPISITVMGGTMTVADFDDLTDSHGEIDWSSSKIIASAQAQIADHITLNFHRAISKFRGEVVARESTPFAAEFFISSHNYMRPEPELGLRVARRIEAISFPGVAFTASGDRTSELVEVFGSQFAKLSDLHSQIVIGAEEARLQHEASLVDRRRELEREFEEARNRASAAAAEEREGIINQAKATANGIIETAERFQRSLEDRASQLDAREIEINDLGHMHERRQLRASISADLKERLTEPPASRAINHIRYQFIGGGMIIALMAAIFVGDAVVQLNDLMGYSGRRTIDELSLYLVVRIALGSTTFIGLSVYMLNWIRRIHDSDLKAEREIERYRYDIDRATWAIETILESRTKDASREVPDEWIRGAVNGLFSRFDDRRDETSATDALAALLSFSAEAELTPQGPRIKLGRRGVQKLGREGREVGE